MYGVIANFLLSTNDSRMITIAEPAIPIFFCACAYTTSVRDQSTALVKKFELISETNGTPATFGTKGYSNPSTVSLSQ